MDMTFWVAGQPFSGTVQTSSFTVTWPVESPGLAASSPIDWGFMPLIVDAHGRPGRPLAAVQRVIE
jgi:hypothetical protein